MIALNQIKFWLKGIYKEGNFGKNNTLTGQTSIMRSWIIDQTNSFARFFEDLAIPKNKGYDSEFLELCNIRHNVIQQMCEYEDAPETNILEFCYQNI